MFGHRWIPIRKSLFIRLSQQAQLLGYASAREMIAHVLEQAVQNTAEKANEAVRKQLKGLGYVD